jgi:hypothetical protein
MIIVLRFFAGVDDVVVKLPISSESNQRRQALQWSLPMTEFVEAILAQVLRSVPPV